MVASFIFHSLIQLVLNTFKNNLIHSSDFYISIAAIAYFDVVRLLYVSVLLLLATVNPNRLLFSIFPSTLNGFVRNNGEKLALTL